MSGAPSDPEKYSIDEMMDRLKTSSSGNSDEEGELVVRADGTQAIRVRKRKRRSSQPVKEQRVRSRRSRILQVSAAMILLIAAALAIGSAVIYANSPPFREGLVRKIYQSTGAAEVDLQMFRMNPKSANANTLTLKWPQGNVLDNLFVRGVRADVFPSSFLGKSMNGEEIIVGEGTLALHIPKPGEPLVAGAATAEALPIHFNRYRIPKLNLTLGDPAAPAISLLKAEASFSPNSLNGRNQFSLNQGDLVISGWPKMRLNRAFLEFRGKEIDVVGLRLMDETDNRGVFEFTGTLLPYSPERLSTLSLQLESFQMGGLTSPAFGKLFAGRIDSLPTTKSNYLTFYPSDTPSPKLAIAFRSSLTSNMVVTGFPFLVALSQTLEDDWFQRPVFEGEDATGSILREANVVRVENLDFENKGRMALRGHIEMNATQALTGSLQIGVAEAMINTAKAARLKTLFGPEKEGFRWVTLKIGGSATNPTDNFKELFLSPPAPSTTENLEPENKGSSFEELTRPK